MRVDAQEREFDMERILVAVDGTCVTVK